MCVCYVCWVRREETSDSDKCESIIYCYSFNIGIAGLLLSVERWINAPIHIRTNCFWNIHSGRLCVALFGRVLTSEMKTDGMWKQKSVEDDTETVRDVKMAFSSISWPPMFDDWMRFLCYFIHLWHRERFFGIRHQMNAKFSLKFKIRGIQATPVQYECSIVACIILNLLSSGNMSVICNSSCSGGRIECNKLHQIAYCNRNTFKHDENALSNDDDEYKQSFHTNVHGHPYRGAPSTNRMFIFILLKRLSQPTSANRTVIGSKKPKKEF